MNIKICYTFKDLKPPNIFYYKFDFIITRLLFIKYGNCYDITHI